ncbi:CDP-diacylglycerol--glycerol-3-phosphate 3-phosphatidyltransferase [Candidatus Auribacterota bacterium]
MNLANKITLFRIILIPFWIGLILKYHQMSPESGQIYHVLAVVVFFSAVLSDGLDGYVARRYKQKTTLGIYLDPMADKLLLVSAVILFSTSIPPFERLPLWFIVSVISRDVIIVMGSLMIYLLTGKLRVAPSAMGKMTTFFQMLTIIWILLIIPHAEYVWRIAGFLTILSGVGYIYTGSKQVNEVAESDHHK